jgi:mannose-6-phosphate isomerase-like protein (cupin superfamily)
MRHPYLIHLDDPNDWLTVNRDIDPRTHAVIEEQHDILWPEGPDEMYEFNDSHFYLSTSYHEHRTGWETFFIHEGGMDLYINRKVATADAGDVLFVPPFTAHMMTMRTPKVIWNGLFHGIGMLTTLHNWALILKSNRRCWTTLKCRPTISRTKKQPPARERPKPSASKRAGYRISAPTIARKRSTNFRGVR